MCVIIVCKRGVPLPPEEELRDAFRRNPDGCGFVSETDHYKSLHFATFMRHLRRRNINENVIIHFRYATHGSVKVKNCHPFFYNGYWFAHNGVLPIISVNDKTDSQICFEKCLYPVIKKFGWASDEQKCEMAYWTRNGSKFAMMHKGELLLSGNFVEMDGRLYSNLNHIKMKMFHI
jgi:hypothetical protein